MGYWGWRPLVMCIFFCVWVVSCTGSYIDAPGTSSTELPPITLQVRQNATLTPTTTPGLPVVATPRQMPTFANQLTPHVPSGAIVTPTPPPIVIQPPTCYGQRDTGILCLGEVHNTEDIALTRVIVRVVILDRAGDVLRVLDVTLPQRIIPGGEFAAYSALFVPIDADGITGLAPRFGGVAVEVIRAERTTSSVQPNVTIIDEVDIQRGGRVIIEGTLHNMDTVYARDIRLFITLYDGLDRLTGFRVANIGDLASEATRMFSVAVSAQNRVEPYRYHIVIEARGDNLR